MIALLDAGNSRFKTARLQGGRVSDAESREYNSSDRAQATVAALNASGAPHRIVVASVLGEDFRNDLTRAAGARLGIRPEFIIPVQSGYGIRVAYSKPQEFGADRFASLVAAHRRFHELCIVVDCGTAVTIDALTADGEHLGGLILPGPDLMRRSLMEHTARIKVGLDDGEDTLFGRSTSQGVQGGALRAVVSAIDHIVQEMTVHISEGSGGGPVKYLMTGGASAVVTPRLTAKYHLEPWLVLQGLAIIAQAET